MGLVIPWSLTLAVVDAFSIFVKRPPRQVAIMSVVTIGDWVCTSKDSFLSLQLNTEISYVLINNRITGPFISIAGCSVLSS